MSRCSRPETRSRPAGHRNPYSKDPRPFHKLRFGGVRLATRCCVTESNLTLAHTRPTPNREITETMPGAPWLRGRVWEFTG